MFCHQCEQTPKGGCKVIGVCGRGETIVSLQDILVFALKIKRNCCLSYARSAVRIYR